MSRIIVPFSKRYTYKRAAYSGLGISGSRPFHARWIFSAPRCSLCSYPDVPVSGLRLPKQRRAGIQKFPYLLRAPTDI